MEQLPERLTIIDSYLSRLRDAPTKLVVYETMLESALNTKMDKHDHSHVILPAATQVLRVMDRNKGTNTYINQGMQSSELCKI